MTTVLCIFTLPQSKHSHNNIGFPFWKIKSIKLKLEISGTLNHKPNLLTDFNNLCFCSSLKTLFKPANSTLQMAPYSELENQQVGASLLFIHGEAERTEC